MAEQAARVVLETSMVSEGFMVYGRFASGCKLVVQRLEVAPWRNDGLPSICLCPVARFN